MGRRLRLVLAVVLACAGALLSGCSSLLARAPRGDVGPQRPPAYELAIEAPDALRTLLQTHLDLARFRTSGGMDEISSTELDRLIAAAPAQAKSLLETEGYFNATVTAQREAGTPARVVMRVAPGPRTVVTSLDIAVQGDLQARSEKGGDALARQTVDGLRKGFNLQPGQPFRQASWAEAKNSAIAWLRAQGYATAQWTATSAQVDAQASQAGLSLTADSGPLFLSGKVVVQGLERQGEESVLNLAGFTPGTPVTEKLLLDYQDRLQKLGLFDRATVELEPDPAQAQAATVTVHVHELPLQQATIGVGYSANTGQRVSLEHTHRRPFGRDVVMHNKFEVGRDLQSWEGELSSHPQEGFYRNLVGGAYERLRASGELTTSSHVRLGRTQDTQAVERLAFLQWEDAELSGDSLDQRAQAVSMNYHGIWRRVDSVLLPTDGFVVTLQGGVGRARSNFGETGNYTRLYGRVTGYKPLGRSWYGQARIEAGQVFTRADVGIPDPELFRAGGDDSVRGYAYRTLGPVVNGEVVGGRVLFTSSAEIARPVSASLPSLWWAAFVDAGQAADKWKDMTLARGYGLGLRWRSPVGPLRVDLAYGQQEQHWRVHLSVGIAY